jgi:hypothetical protein
MPVNFFLFFLLYFLGIYIYKMAKIKKKERFRQVSSKYGGLVFAEDENSRILPMKTINAGLPHIQIDILKVLLIASAKIRLKYNKKAASF